MVGKWRGRDEKAGGAVVRGDVGVEGQVRADRVGGKARSNERDAEGQRWNHGMECKKGAVEGWRERGSKSTQGCERIEENTRISGLRCFLRHGFA